MRVVNGFNSYVLLDLFTGKEKEFRLPDVKPFVSDSAVIGPLDTVRRDHMEHFIDKIFDDCGNIKKKTTLEFHVSWVGYTQESSTWELYT